jgi:hypothetical protein
MKAEAAPHTIVEGPCVAPISPPRGRSGPFGEFRVGEREVAATLPPSTGSSGGASWRQSRELTVVVVCGARAITGGRLEGAVGAVTVSVWLRAWLCLRT